MHSEMPNFKYSLALRYVKQRSLLTVCSLLEPRCYAKCQKCYPPSWMQRTCWWLPVVALHVVFCEQYLILVSRPSTVLRLYLHTPSFRQSQEKSWLLSWGFDGGHPRKKIRFEQLCQRYSMSFFLPGTNTSVNLPAVKYRTGPENPGAT